MIVLAIDQGNNHFGYSVWDKDKLYKYGNFTTKLTTEDERYIRLKEVYDELVSLIDCYEPDIVVCEGLWYGQNINTFKNLVMINAFLLQLSWERNFQFKEINIRKYRHFFGIKGKSEVKKFILTSFPDIVVDKKLDITDAILLGQYIVKKGYDLEKC